MPDSGPDSFGFVINDIARLLRQRLERAFADSGLGLTPGEARTLAYIARDPGQRQTLLAEKLNVEPMTLVGFLDRLETAGLIERRPDPADRRAKNVRPTAAAEPVIARIREISALVRASALRSLPSADAERLLRNLIDVRNALVAGTQSGEVK